MNIGTVKESLKELDAALEEMGLEDITALMPLRHNRQSMRVRLKKFIVRLAQTGNVSLAVRSSGLARATVYRLKEESPDFSSLWESAMEIAIDVLEAEAWRRAVDGVQEPVVSKGVVVGHVRRYSDRLLERLLEANRPRKFRQTMDHQVAGTVSVVYDIQGLDKPEPLKKVIDVTPGTGLPATK